MSAIAVFSMEWIGITITKMGTDKLDTNKECILVGCVPAARRPYAWVCFLGGGLPGPGGVGGAVSAPGGVSVSGGVCLVLRGCLLPGEGGCLPALGGCLPGPGGCLPGLGGCLPGLGGCVSQHALRQTPSPPPCGQNSWHTLLKILPWPNFVAAGNKELSVVLKCCDGHHQTVDTEYLRVSGRSRISRITVERLAHFHYPYRDGRK